MSLFRNFKSYLPALITLSIGVGILGYNAPAIISEFAMEKDAEDFDKDEEKKETKKGKKEETKSEEETSEDKENDETLDEDTLKSGIREHYNEYINLIANKIIEVRPKRDIVGDFAMYRTMLANGYFSYGAFAYLKPNVEFDDIRGANVVIGEGVCLNEAHNMADVFTSMGYQAKVVIGKDYYKGNKIPEYANHAVVYVSDGEFSYILDPTNDTIFLRHAHLLYYAVESQEDTIHCFEPVVYYCSDGYGSYIATEVLEDFFNDHKKHWDVLKAYRNYKGEAEGYLDEFKNFEESELLNYEEYFYNVFKIIGDMNAAINEANKAAVKGLGY